MAKIKFGMIVTDGRGKLGGQVFSKNRSGAYIRTKVTPSNPQTLAQQSVRAVLGNISASWSGLSDAQRQSFNSAVDNWAKTDIFGDLKNPTGKNLFTKLNINLTTAGLPNISVAPVKSEIPFMGLTAVIGDVSSSTLLANVTEVPTGFVVVVSATAPQTAGTSFFRGKYRDIAVVPGADINTENLWSAYVAKFGAPVVDDNISFQLRIIADNGQASVPEMVKATIVA